MEIKQHSTMKGEYKIVLNEGTDRETTTGWCPNMITDAGLNNIGAGAASTAYNYYLMGSTAVGTTNPYILSNGYCKVGTGTTSVTASDTTLAQALTPTANVESGYSVFVNRGSADNYGHESTRRYSFALGAIVGNITELGIFFLNNVMWSRCKIVDTNNNPTTITVTADDILTIYYRLVIYIPSTDQSVSFTLNGTTYTGTLRHHCDPGISYTQWNIREPIQVACISLYGNTYDGNYVTGWSQPIASSNTLSAQGTSLMPYSSPYSVAGGSALPYSAVSRASYTTGSFSNSITIAAGVNDWNTANIISRIDIYSQYYYSALADRYAPHCQLLQLKLDTPIPKTNTQVLKLTFTHTFGRA